MQGGDKMQLSIKQARLISGKTQQDMAHELDMHVQTYAKIEKNPESATIEQAKRIAAVLHVKIDDLFFLITNST